MIKPLQLHKGDTIGVCCPSGTISHKKDLFERAKQNFEKAIDVQLVVAPHTLGKHYYSSGTPQERLDDFHSLVANEDVKAIVFAAGGDTAIDLVQKLDYDLIQSHPKIITGISDATTLLSAITAKTGLITFLGLEFLDFADHPMPYTLASIQKAWFEGDLGTFSPNPQWVDLKNFYSNYHGWQTIRSGVAEGQLVGGNAQSFVQLLNTEYELSPKDAVLFFETYKLPKKQIHKLCMQLQLRGVFDKIQGLVVGYCLESDDPQVIGNEQPLADLLLDVTRDHSFPILHIGEIGHNVENALQPIGARVKVDATKPSFAVLENVTE